VFIPYHWPLERSVNNCTQRAIDPISNIPEFKYSAVRVTKAEAPDDGNARLTPSAGGAW
jgi:assimilatory nitrate reductase catalytic subunit